MLDSVLGEVERRLLVQALERTDGGRKAAAKLLGISFRSLRYRLQKHAIDADGEENGDDDSLSVSDSAPADSHHSTKPAT